MKTFSLAPYTPPPPVEKPSCAACKAFAPECLVPHGDGALAMCWYCAHHVVEHGVDLSAAHCATCECLPRQILPLSRFTEQSA